jgi:nucleotide-binding universal stress UspA family protein
LTVSVFPAKVLLAIDGSEEAGLAAQAATELSKETGSEVHVTFVLPRPEALIGHHTYSAEVRESVLEQARSEARQFLDGRAEQLRAEGAKVAQAHLRIGEPDKEIIRLSEEIGATLIVMGSRGLGAVSRALMGSVSDSVVKHAHCPVLVMRH